MQFRRKSCSFYALATCFKLSCGFAGLIIGLCALFGCSRSGDKSVQGYVEGEFVYIASALPGYLDTLAVQRGTEVKEGDLLFVLDSTVERATLDETNNRLAQAIATLNDSEKGRRPTEIQSIEAQIEQVKAALALSELELARQEQLLRTSATAAQDLDRARSARDQDRERVAQLEADLKTARLGSRSDQIAAARAGVRVQEAALAKAKWDFSQKRQTSTQPALVFDTLYREGEWVAAGRPVVALLPPKNIKVRAFVPETLIATIRPGNKVMVAVDGMQEALAGEVGFISPRAEYTPPVIYSRDSRSKLVFMVEILFAPKTAAKLHPGQPVDVQFGP